MKNFYHSPACIAQCPLEYIFLIKKNNIETRRQKAKGGKRISVENLTGYDNIVCEFALCTF